MARDFDDLRMIYDRSYVEFISLFSMVMPNNHEVYSNYSWSSIDDGGMTMLHRPLFTQCQMIMLCEWFIYTFTPKHPRCKQMLYRWNVWKGGSVHCYMLKSLSRFRCCTREKLRAPQPCLVNTMQSIPVSVSNQPFVWIILLHSSCRKRS